MSAAHHAALAAVDRADNASGDARIEDYPAVLAQVATARAILALVDEVEPIVGLLQRLVEPAVPLKGTGRDILPIPPDPGEVFRR